MSETTPHGTAVVTGGASGIGAACAARLREDHERVVVLDRTAAGVADAIEVDVADPTAIADAVTSIGGTVRTLVCAAGVQGYGTVTDTDPAEFDRVMRVNVTGVYLSCRAMVPRMPAPASIVVVASVQAYAAQDRVVAYAASKGALLAMVRAMAVDEAARGIRVNAVCPGSIDTPMLRASAATTSSDGDIEAVVTEWGRAHALGRVGLPAEVAEVAAFLADPVRAAFVTGTDIRVDGGLTAQLPVRLT